VGNDSESESENEHEDGDDEDEDIRAVQQAHLDPMLTPDPPHAADQEASILNFVIGDQFDDDKWEVYSVPEVKKIHTKHGDSRDAPYIHARPKAPESGGKNIPLIRTAGEYLSLLFTDDIMKILCESSNSYAIAKNKSNWVHLTVAELGFSFTWVLSIGLIALCTGQIQYIST
jgi:hypothetical protein